MTIAHTARHSLPISNGYSYQSGGPVVVYCGRCDGYFHADAEWADRHFAMRRARVESDARLAPGGRADALAELDHQKSQLVAMLAA